MLEKEKIVSKYITTEKVVSIIGLSKNAGKTTVLNKLIEEQKNQLIAITSIGLDGEKIDNVNHKPKPRIKVFKGMIIATAEDCLKEIEILYAIHEKTQIQTALGNIVIIEALSDGFVLVAGPSTKTKMKNLLLKLKKYQLKRIYLDGALFRKSFSIQEIVDGMILVTGAAYSRSMEKTISDSRTLIDQLSLKKNPEPYNYGLVDTKNKGYMIEKGFDKDTILNMIIKNKINVKYLRLTGAFTDKIARRIIDYRLQFLNATIELDDTISFICKGEYYEKLRKVNIHFCVKNSVPVLFLAINPYSPDGYEYDKVKFKKSMQSGLKLKCINVLSDVE